MNKKYYYVQVISQNKIKFITGNDYINRISKWDEDKMAYEFKTKKHAEDIALGLCLNGFYAFVVQSIYKLEFQNSDL